jgi:hypothetical protein
MLFKSAGILYCGLYENDSTYVRIRETAMPLLGERPCSILVSVLGQLEVEN